MLFKVSDLDLKVTELVTAESIEDLKTQASEVLYFDVVEIVRANDGSRIRNNAILKELAKSGELHVVCLAEEEEYNGMPTVTKSRIKDSVLRDSEISDSGLKSSIISDRGLSSSVSNGSKTKSALKSQSEYADVDVKKTPEKAPLEFDSIEDDEDDNQLQSFTDLKNDLKNFKLNLKSKNASKNVKEETTNEDLTTEAFEKEKKVREEKLRKSEEAKRKQEKRLEELKSLDTSIVNAQKESEDLKGKVDDRKKEISRIKMETKTNIAIAKSELDELEHKKINLQIRKAKISMMFKEFVQAEKVDLCFLVDCTGSMSSYINETKMAIHRIVDKLSKIFKDFDLKCSFVGYRDIEDGANRFSVLPFQSNMDLFKSFVNGVKATGGADQCEDVFGGLDKVTKLDWTNMSRVLFHVADAPCHGKRFHSGAFDSYPDGDPDGLSITSLMKKLNELNVKYYFAEINTSTVKMIEEFNKELSLVSSGDEITVVKLASASDMTEMVTASVASTIHASKSLSMAVGGDDAKRKTAKVLRVDKTCLTWDKAKLKKHKAELLASKYVGGIEDIQSKDTIKFDRKDVEIYIANTPFAKGAARYAFTGVLKQGDLETKCVVKESTFDDEKSNSFENYKEIIESQLVAKKLCSEFSTFSKAEKTIEYLQADILQLKENGKYYTVEEYVEGKFVKWSNNAGGIEEDIYANTLDSFSHWTYSITGEYLIVTDIQGWISGSKYILTDPAILSAKDPYRFSNTNLGLNGIKKYFETHKCNDHCRAYRLVKHKDQPAEMRVGGTKVRK